VPDADGLWQTATNWSSTPALPGSGDDVVINVAGDRLITLSSGTQSIKSLDSSERMLISGAGTVLQVGTGHWEAGRVSEIIASRDRQQAGRVVKAVGLHLQWIRF